MASKEMDLNVAFDNFNEQDTLDMERITAPPARVLLAQAGLLPAPAPGAQAVILDNAGGTGLVTQILHDDCPGAAFKVTIADLNPTMINKAKERIARNAGWEGRVDAVVADAQATKLPDDHFTHAMMNFGLQFMPDKIAALKETLRILKPGGVLGMTVWTSPGWLDSLIKGCPGWTTPPALVNPLGRPGIVEMLRAAGLPPSSLSDSATTVTLKVEEVEFEMRHPTERFLEFGKRLLPPRTVTPEGWEEYKVYFRERYGEEATLTWKAVVFTVTKPES